MFKILAIQKTKMLFVIQFSLQGFLEKYSKSILI